jgi:uncharacterized membrane protein YfcA
MRTVIVRRSRLPTARSSAPTSPTACWAQSIGAVFGPLSASSLPGIIISSYFSVRVPESVLRFTLAATLILVVGRLVL